MSKKSKKEKRELPKEILVRREKSHLLPSLVPCEDMDQIPETHDGKLIGIYVLDRTLRFTVKRQLKND